MARELILPKGTGTPLESDEFFVTRGYPCTICAFPVANIGSNIGSIMIKNEDGNWDPTFDGANNPKRLTATNPHEIVDGLGFYRVEWDGRAAAIGVTARRI